MTDYDPNAIVTEPIKSVTSTLVLPRFADDGSPFEVPPDAGSEDWPTHVAKHGIRLRIPTAILLALFLAVGGLWGGSVLQKQEGSTAGTTGAAAARAAFSRAGGGGSSVGASGSATTGTVTDIVGNTLYVTNSSGQLIKVTLSSSATVTRNASSSLSGLKPGDTVTVQGTTPKNGSMTASSVAATAKGVSSTGGFGAGGGFAGAPGGGANRSGASS
jgi:hypothetical protein